MHGPSACLIAALLEPERTLGFSLREWSTLISTARAANLLGRLAERLRDADIDGPAPAARHLDGARQLSERQHRSVTWEAHCLQRALGGLGVPVVLLKGAAYVMGGLPVSRGRLFGDIDILVPRAALGDVEIHLMINGWTSAKTDPYDQMYYRQWMHELPPMVNLKRGTVIDVHHTILPLTSTSTPDAERIIARSAALPELPALRIPCPEDLVIHSITHLMHEGELHNGLRDLSDIDDLLRRFDGMPGFWDRLPEYAVQHGLAYPVAFGLRLVQSFFGTPVPAAVLRSLDGDRPAGFPSSLLESIYRQAIRPDGEGSASVPTRMANLALYVRAHHLRMPFPLLLRHLARKALMRRKAGTGPAETR
ncbi:nucleotidyltransferase domain-containing protein [Thauera sinica]|uniref:Nucleotidyltransferase family protein n=1 Tax=Thauera sinica TaxID=2665146 RepID=A0ABW1ARC3_9RHOO|nr:nucleotidyltransferase family protein [Thauera sp. K11]ATE59014.1 hypothetical protein CCZ27_02720 [Thauera sp. K11]